MINYRFINNKWHLGYVRSELVMVIKWKKRLFSSRYIVRSEMAVQEVSRNESCLSNNWCQKPEELW